MGLNNTFLKHVLPLAPNSKITDQVSHESGTGLGCFTITVLVAIPYHLTGAGKTFLIGDFLANYTHDGADLGQNHGREGILLKPPFPLPLA